MNKRTYHNFNVHFEAFNDSLGSLRTVCLWAMPNTPEVVLCGDETNHSTVLYNNRYTHYVGLLSNLIFLLQYVFVYIIRNRLSLCNHSFFVILNHFVC